MNRFSFLALLAVLFVSDYALAQIPSCPCDTLELQDGTTGSDIVELLCPGGELGEGTEFSLEANIVQIGNEVAGYGVTRFPGGCGFGQDGIGGNGEQVSPQEALNCRESLIERCDLKVSNSIPTLSQWGMIAMAGVLGMIGLFVAARRRKAAA